MYIKRHEQFEIGCGAILNKIYYYIIIIFILWLKKGEGLHDMELYYQRCNVD